MCFGRQFLLGGSGGNGAPSSSNESLFDTIGGNCSKIRLAVSIALVIVDITRLSNSTPLFANRSPTHFACSCPATNKPHLMEKKEGLYNLVVFPYFVQENKSFAKEHELLKRICSIRSHVNTLYFMESQSEHGNSTKPASNIVRQRRCGSHL